MAGTVEEALEVFGAAVAAPFAGDLPRLLFLVFLSELLEFFGAIVGVFVLTEGLVEKVFAKQCGYEAMGREGLSLLVVAEPGVGRRVTSDGVGR